MWEVRTDPPLSVQPREIVRLRVVVAEFHIMVVSQLLYLRQCYPVTLRRKRYQTLHTKHITP